MSKYEPLWKWIAENKTDNFKLTWAEIKKVAGIPIDHSFLTFKKGTAGIWVSCREGFDDRTDRNFSERKKLN